MWWHLPSSILLFQGRETESIRSIKQKETTKGAASAWGGGVGWGILVRLVGDEQRGVHRLHAGWAGEGAHEPVVDAVRVVGVHAGEVADAVADHELDHADDTSGKRETKIKNCFGNRHFSFFKKISFPIDYFLLFFKKRNNPRVL